MTTSGLRVPPVHRPALGVLRDLQPDAFERLRSSFSDAPPYTSLSELPKRVTGVEGLADDDASAIVYAVLSLYAQLKFHGFTVEGLAEGISRSQDLPPTDEAPDPAVLADRLTALLGMEAITTTGRAVDLLGEHEHIFHSARLLTDIRPVFGTDPTEPPTGALITETLKLEYFDEGETRSLYVALDQDDLRQLQRTVNRAVEKTESLRGFLEGIGLAHFALETEDGGNSK